MSVKIASNISSLGAQRRLSEATATLSGISEKLSSGLRINRAADDAAGLQIAEGLRTDARVFSQAVRNVNDGLSLLNIAQGAVEQLSTIVLRQAELAEQAINGTYSYKQRTAMDAEVNALVKEYNRIVKTTSFNGINTLTGVTNALRMQLGYGENGGIQVRLGSNFGYAAGDATYTLGYASNLGGITIEQSLSADINSDGLLDLVIGSTLDATSFTLLSNGDGSFKAPVSIGNIPGNLKFVDDFNGDGIADLLVQNGSTTKILTGNGNGTFNLGVSQVTNSMQEVFKVDDLNRDGILDLITEGGVGLVSFLGNGDGTFRIGSSTIELFQTPYGVMIGDLNNDGIPDLLSSNVMADSQIIALLGNGDGSFNAAYSFSSSNTAVRFTIADFNGDGLNDLVSLTGDADVDLFIGKGDGTFEPLQAIDATLGAGTPKIKVQSKDMNGDGNLDILITGAIIDADTEFVTLLGNGDGSFRAAISTATGNQYDGTVGDFNEDGIPDLISVLNGDIQLYSGHAESSGRRNNLMQSIDLKSRYGAKQALYDSKKSLARISLELGSLGAMQSRLVVANNELVTARENFIGAESQLTDTDVATSSAALVSTKIRQQGAAAILAQANQQPKLALSLLGAEGVR